MNTPQNIALKAILDALCLSQKEAETPEPNFFFWEETRIPEPHTTTQPPETICNIRLRIEPSEGCAWFLRFMRGVGSGSRFLMVGQLKNGELWAKDSSYISKRLCATTLGELANAVMPEPHLKNQSASAKTLRKLLLRAENFISHN